MELKKKAFICPIVFGIIMIIIGFCIQIPGGVLTTYSSLDGEKDEESYYSFDNKYSAIDEYVGGDAYNYEIGASLVAGKTAGAMTSRSIFIVGGLMCICVGITLMMMQNEKKIALNNNSERLENKDFTSVDLVSEYKEEDKAINTQNNELE